MEKSTMRAVKTRGMTAELPKPRQQSAMIKHLINTMISTRKFIHEGHFSSEEMFDLASEAKRLIVDIIDVVNTIDKLNMQSCSICEIIPENQYKGQQLMLTCAFCEVIKEKTGSTR